MGLLRSLLTTFALAIAMGWIGVGPSVVHAQQTTDAPNIAVEASPKDLRELIRLLADEGVQNWLKESAAQANTSGILGSKVGFREQFHAALNDIRDRITALGTAWNHLPAAPEKLAKQFESRIRTSDTVRNLTFVVIFLFVGAGLEWLYRQYATAPLLRLTLQNQKSPLRRVFAASKRAAIIFLGLIIFAFGSIGVFLTFQWQPMAESTVLELLFVVIFIRTVRTVSLFFLAPRVPDLRLVPLSNKSAKYYHMSWMWVASVFILTSAVSELFPQISNEDGGNPPPETLAILVGFATVFVLTVLYQIWHGAKHAIKGADYAKRRRIFYWRTYLSILLVLIFLFWLIGTQSAMLSLLVIGLVNPVLAIVSVWIDHFLAMASQAFALEQVEAAAAAAKVAEAAATTKEAETDQDVPESGAVVPPIEEIKEIEVDEDHYAVYRPIVQRAARFVVIIGAVILLSVVSGTSFLSLSQAPTIAGRVFSVLVHATIIILIADLIWIWAKGVIDKRLSLYVPPEGSEAPGPEARMATLLPLLRMTLLVALFVIVLFSILSSLGVNIAPLLAGAGVLGIAIGFGTQSLVRDIVSGIFFLIDDAFRLGEYIEVGELRGTVESISIRSLRVRHHRGMVHTIPFGELKYLTNYSRDWVIMKLEFRVPFDTDLSLVKKLVKKVGAEMLENEFYGPGILQTLKSQGVRRMEEFNMVVGVKFMTKPGEQWLVRRDAYQKVRDAFEANGIRMAERNVKVEIQGGETLDEKTRQAASAAAQVAIEGPGGPPKAIPDEP